MARAGLRRQVQPLGAESGAGSGPLLRILAARDLGVVAWQSWNRPKSSTSLDLSNAASEWCTVPIQPYESRGGAVVTDRAEPPVLDRVQKSPRTYASEARSTR